jgi:hypothetical protein
MHSSIRNSVALAMAMGILIVSSGCVYRANISQGNIVEEEDLDQVEAKRWVTILFDGDTVSEIQRNRDLAEGL